MEESIGLSQPEQDCLKKCCEAEAQCRSMWIRAMSFAPKLACYCTHWSDFTPAEWVKIVVDNRDLISIAPIHLLQCEEWGLILRCQPSLIDYCPASVLNSFPAKVWQVLVEEYPWFQKYREQKNFYKS